MRDINQAGLDLIKSFEGILDGDPSTTKLDPYLDPVGIWTIGWGHAIRVGNDFLRGAANRARARALYPGGLTMEQAEALLETVREETGVEAHLRWRGSSSVGRGLHELCELLGADLVAVGSPRRGLLGRVLVGDDTSAALNGAPCSIAIAPTNYSQQPGAMREIGVGYDGSPESEHALSVARMLADASGAKLSALEAVSLPSDATADIKTDSFGK